MNKVPLYLVSEGKASYPELAAYRDFFEDKFDISIVSVKGLPNDEALKDAVLWFLMGFYPRRLSAQIIIHDYRSASVGRFNTLKDFTKRHFTAQPDARIFLNDDVRDRFSFDDKVPEFLLDMGLPGEIFDSSYATVKKEYDFCYVGAINSERQIDQMIASFRKTYGGTKSLLLVGRVDPEISELIGADPSIHCTGQVSQTDVFSLVRKSKIAISWIPDRAPYHNQTPTKLLEYAALGVPVIVNASRSNLTALEKFSIHAEVVRLDFPSNEELEKISANDPDAFRAYEWQNVIRRSGIADFLLKTASLGL